MAGDARQQRGLLSESNYCPLGSHPGRSNARNLPRKAHPGARAGPFGKTTATKAEGGFREGVVDHVVPRARGGGNGCRNLVSACAECNSLKRERQAEDFIRWLCREGRLSVGELSGRLGALAQVAAGKLQPALPSQRGSASSKISE